MEEKKESDRRKILQHELADSPQRLGRMVVKADKEVHRCFGSRILIDDMTSFLPPPRVAASSTSSGPSCTDKTTLFKVIIGQEQPDSDTIRLGETVKLCYVDQKGTIPSTRTDRLFGRQ